jgi:hypothetical protein
MASTKIVYWQENGGFGFGYLQDHSDYMSQSLTLEELKENLKDIYKDITGGLVPKVRTVEEMEVA